MNNLLLGTTKTKPHQVYYTLLWKYYTNYSMRFRFRNYSESNFRMRIEWVCLIYRYIGDWNSSLFVTTNAKDRIIHIVHTCICGGKTLNKYLWQRHNHLRFPSLFLCTFQHFDPPNMSIFDCNTPDNISWETVPVSILIIQTHSPSSYKCSTDV